jgi:hypothetical protein
VLVYDRLDGRSEHDVSVRWPLHRSLEAEIVATDEAHATASRGKSLAVKVAATTPGSLSVVTGAHEPFEGWSAPRLDQLVPSPLLKWDTVFEGRLDVCTLLSSPGVGASAIDLRLQVDSGDVRIEVAGPTHGHALVLDLDANALDVARIAGSLR